MAIVAALSLVGFGISIGMIWFIGLTIGAAVSLSLSLGGVFQNDVTTPNTPNVEGFNNQQTDMKTQLEKRWKRIKKFDFMKEYRKFKKMLMNEACFGKDTELIYKVERKRK